MARQIPVPANDIEDILDQLSVNRSRLTLRSREFNIPVTNLDRIFWPATKNRKAFTKRDLIIYYAKISPYLLPHTQGRPITFVRFPQGAGHSRFYQKHFAQDIPPFVETVRIFSESYNEDQSYVLCNNLPTLIWLAQIANLELHTWAARVSPAPENCPIPLTFAGSADNISRSLLNYPDFIFFDLDPYIYSGKEGKGEEPELNPKAWKKTCQVAHWLKDLLDSTKLKVYIKTTGKTGLHIYLPMVRQLTYDQARATAATIGQLINSQHPHNITMEWLVSKRTGKVFFDHNMNARGKTLASIYSPRANSLGSVSTPINWDELDDVYPTDFDMENIFERLAQVGDLWGDILQNKNNMQFLFQDPA